MIRPTLVSAALVAGLLTSSHVAAGSAARGAQAAAPAPATAAEAAPFLGDWTLTLEGPNGAAGFDLTVKVETDKVVGEISGAGMGPQPITDVSKADKSLVLRYSFDYQGTPVAAVVSLTPAADGKTSAQIDFAGGAYLMTGSAAKKEQVK
jgi:hypothetical protein